ncbi:ABC transporter substrate-binding protein [Gracilibacillus alcaliphilus]|uniref:ABC transporter substrate-binding protein n=1 Tax=Gracilibacillus alcaliphilus TaxID=1401441 RepID=UPI00195E0648|nr:ABC transporter substrate-binding protein [Gracilibacillus alcaliphilus]MBM7679219.1 multiple sugar transport system substrate-binding protein [Gracilibacillus alcaliphilus]
MTKKISLSLAFGLLLLFLSGCGIWGQQTSNASENESDNNSTDLVELDPDNPTTITFYTYSLAVPTMKEGMEQLINDFNDTVGKEKGVIVEPVADPNYQQYRADITAGKDVDVIQHTFGTLDASRLNLDFKAYEDVFPAEELEEHLEGISENALQLGVIDNKMYGLAFTFSTPIVFINGGLFEEAGLDPNDPPETWEEVKEYALQIKEKTGKDGFGLEPDNGWVTDSVFFSNGADIMTEDRSEAVFASEKGIEAIEIWKDIYNSGAHATGSTTEVPEQFMAGNLGMYITSTALHSGFKAAAEAGGWELYGAGLPQFGDQPSIPVNSGSALAVRPDSPEKKAATWEFIKYVTGPEGYTTITEQIGYLPLRTDLAEDPNYLQGFVEEHPLYQINLAQLEHIRPATIWPGEVATEASTIFRDAIVEAVSTEADVTKTLKNAEENINILLK